MDLIVLGSGGGPQPNPDRSSPALAIGDADAWYAIDTGHGIARQAVRAGLPLKNLRGTFITHHHVDHTADLGSLHHLAWTAGLVQTVPVVGPTPLAGMIDDWLHMQRVDVDHRESLGRPALRGLIDAREFHGDGVVFTDERISVRAGAVVHPPLEAYGYRIDTPRGTVAISGDTGYCDEMGALAEGADVLVHEAYSPDDLHLLTRETTNKLERIQKHFRVGHTSAEDAGRVAARAGVRTLVLWHLIPTTQVPAESFVEQAARHFDGEVLAAPDLTRVPIDGTPDMTGRAS